MVSTRQLAETAVCLNCMWVLKFYLQLKL